MSNQPFFRRWRMPLLMALLILFGLLSALLGAGMWQALAWVSLIVPLLTIVWHTFRKP